MIAKPRGSVTLPRIPRGFGNLLKHAKEVNQCLQQLRDRVVITRSGSGGKASALPFQVTATTTLLVAAPGTIGSTGISGSVLEVASPADGTHYLIGKIVINATTGAITSETVYWATSVPSNTTTDFYSEIAFVEIATGAITDAGQYKYGPIYAIVGGGAVDTWIVNQY